MRKKAPRNAKNGPAGLKSEPGWAKMSLPGALFGHFGALLAKWGDPLRIFMHFCEVLVNTCDFLLKINGNSGKNEKIAGEIADFTYTDRNSA